MKQKLLLLIAGLFATLLAPACPVCERQQPKLLRGITHGTGPQGYMDWIIVSSMLLLTLVILVFSLKHLVRPGEKQGGHIKQRILHLF